jgi:uncharacterized YccA/Bax inhibitor family protein
MLTSNPILRNFESADPHDHSSTSKAGVTTLRGTILKSIALLLVLSVIAGVTSMWPTGWARTHHGHVAYLFIKRIFSVSFFGAILIVIATVLRKRIAPITAPFFAVTEGVALGITSATFNLRFPGIITQAVGLTVAMCVCLLTAYGLGWVTLGEAFSKKMSIAVSGAIAYCAGSVVLALAGIRGVPILTAGIPGVLVSIGVVVLPGAVLVSTCDAAVQRATEGKPKYMEWYAALGIVASLVWVYYEMLEALSKGRRSR